MKQSVSHKQHHGDVEKFPTMLFNLELNFLEIHINIGELVEVTPQIKYDFL